MTRAAAAPRCSGGAAALPSTPTANETDPPVPRWPHVHALGRRPSCDNYPSTERKKKTQYYILVTCDHLLQY